MKQRVLLTYKTHEGGESDPFGSLLPVGLGYLHAILRGAGLQSQLANLSRYSWTRIESFIKKAAPDVLGISQFTHNRAESIRLAAIAKRIHPGCFIVFGGPHATAAATQTLRNFPVVDAVVIGEGEETFPELLSVLVSKGPDELGRVRGITFRWGDEVISTPPRPPLTDLDSLPIPAVSLPGSPGVDVRRQAEFIITSRGCPSSCTFCSSPRFWGSGLRFRSPRAIIDEMRYLRDRLGLIYFSIRDDTFTADRTRVIEFCRLLLDEKIYVLWNCQSRVTAVDPEMLQWMKRAGCECIQYGIESGSPDVLKRLGKRITPEEIRTAALETRRAGINLSIYLITGVPGEGEKDLTATLKLIQAIRPMDGQVSPLAYYPGTALFTGATKAGVISKDVFLREKSEALLVRSDPFPALAKKRLLDQLSSTAAGAGFSAKEIRAQKDLLGFCHATNIMAGDTYAERGELGQAEREYREIVTRQPTNPWGWLSLAELYLGSGSTEKAMAAFSEVVRIVPRHLPGWEALAEIAALMGDAAGLLRFQEEVRRLSDRMG